MLVNLIRLPNGELNICNLYDTLRSVNQYLRSYARKYEIFMTNIIPYWAYMVGFTI